MRAALLSLLVLAVPVRADESEYYPLKVGTRWTYRIVGPGGKLIVTAVKQETVGGQACVRLEGRLRDPLAGHGVTGAAVAGVATVMAFYHEELVGVEHVAVLNDGVYRFKFGDQAIQPPLCFFKPAAQKAEAWQHEFKVGETAASSKYEADAEDVTVPAGAYKGALVVRGEATEKKEVTKTTMWFAKGVGMVKQQIDLGGAKVTLELEKVEMPKE